jgi:Protein of unknown function (DUF4256)
MVGALSINDILPVLEVRFAKYPHRHAGLRWSDVQERLQARPAAIGVLIAMENTGGEPDVVGMQGSAIVFVDCSAESPAGRRSLCFDRAALDARKENKPVGAAAEMAAHIGIEMLDEAQYRDLQAIEAFDRKTSSWLRTPDAIRALGGALFGDRRYDTVFTYHNGAESYYAVRGFRGRLLV